jgi:hypothetical protein
MVDDDWLVVLRLLWLLSLRLDVLLEPLVGVRLLLL